MRTQPLAQCVTQTVSGGPPGQLCKFLNSMMASLFWEAHGAIRRGWGPVLLPTLQRDPHPASSVVLDLQPLEPQYPTILLFHATLGLCSPRSLPAGVVCCV